MSDRGLWTKVKRERIRAYNKCNKCEKKDYEGLIDGLCINCFDEKLEKVNKK